MRISNFTFPVGHLSERRTRILIDAANSVEIASDGVTLTWRSLRGPLQHGASLPPLTGVIAPQSNLDGVPDAIAAKAREIWAAAGVAVV